MPMSTVDAEKLLQPSERPAIEAFHGLHRPTQLACGLLDSQLSLLEEEEDAAMVVR